MQTKAELDGDEWVINGQKIWTSTAHLSQMCFILVRTEPDAPKHQGISYLLMPMDAEGIDRRPIKQMTGDSDFNELFLTDVRIPAENIVGKRGEGWKVANATLGHERGSLADPNVTQNRLNSLIDLMKSETIDGQRVIDKPIFRDRLLSIQGRLMAQQSNALRILSSQINEDQDANLAKSIVKLQGTELRHELEGLAIDAMGELGTLYEDSPHLRDEGAWQMTYMYFLGLIIGGGTNQIQKNIISERALGMPKEPKIQGALIMYFGLSEEQKSLEENIQRFLSDNASLDIIKAVANGDEDKAKEVHKGIIELGLSGLIVPEEYGGLELNMLFATVVSAALGSGTAPVPFAGSYIMSPMAINLAGNAEQKNNWLPKIAGGEVQVGVGISEYVGAREDAGIEFTNGKVSGRSLFVIDGKGADAYILANKSGELYLIDSNNSGIEVVELTTVDKTRTSIELILNDVDAEFLEGSKDKAIIEKVLDAGRLMLAADTVGAAQVMLDKSVAYSLERKQFGRLIGSFQAVKHMCAEMAADLEPCHSMIWHAAHCQDNVPEEARLMACQTKAHISEVGKQVSKTATEVHGGMGFTDELGLHYWFKRIGLNRQLLGSPELVREEAGKLQGFDQ